METMVAREVVCAKAVTKLESNARTYINARLAERNARIEVNAQLERNEAVYSYLHRVSF